MATDAESLLRTATLDQGSGAVQGVAIDAVEKKMEREFQSLFQELSESGLLSEPTA